MTESKTKPIKILTLFGSYLVLIALTGAAVALLNRYLRLHDLATPFTLGLLVVVLIIVYYLLWRWLRRMIDRTSASGQSTEKEN